MKCVQVCGYKYYFNGQNNSKSTLKLIKATVRIVNSTFVSNRKGSYTKCVTDYHCFDDGFIGGAIIATNSTIGIRQSKFEHNGAEFGGAIFAEQQSIINMSGNVFINNTATQDGGVLFLNNSRIRIEASDLHNNNATVG